MVANICPAKSSGENSQSDRLNLYQVLQLIVWTHHNVFDVSKYVFIVYRFNPFPPKVLDIVDDAVNRYLNNTCCDLLELAAQHFSLTSEEIEELASKKLVRRQYLDGMLDILIYPPTAHEQLNAYQELYLLLKDLVSTDKHKEYFQIE